MAFARDAVVFIVYTVILNKMIDMEMCIKTNSTRKIVKKLLLDDVLDEVCAGGCLDVVEGEHDVGDE